MKKENKNEFETKMSELGFREASEAELPFAVRNHRKALKKKEKQRISINLDKDIVTYFKQASGGKGYQTMINNALRSLVNADSEPLTKSLLNNPEFIEGLKEKLGI